MAADKTVLDRVQELTWALVDDEISDDETSLLDSLLLSDDAACKHYIECVQLHADLMAHFAAKAPAASTADASKSPVLGFLHAGAPPLGFGVPPAGDVNS